MLSMTRIIGGLAGSIKLNSPAKATRPTSDRIRESIFSRLDARDLLEGLRPRAARGEQGLAPESLRARDRRQGRQGSRRRRNRSRREGQDRRSRYLSVKPPLPSV